MCEPKVGDLVESMWEGKKITTFGIKCSLFKFFSYLCSEKYEGAEAPCFIVMIEKIKVLDIVKEALEGTDKYLVNLKITPDNRIFVDIDGDNGITIDDCIELSRTVENSLDRDEEDFELNVSSAGADSPLKLPRQYRRHEGREVTVETLEGERYEGKLMDSDEERFSIRTKGTKKQAPEVLTFNYTEVKSTKVVIKF